MKSGYYHLVIICITELFTQDCFTLKHSMKQNNKLIIINSRLSSPVQWSTHTDDWCSRLPATQCGALASRVPSTTTTMSSSAADMQFNGNRTWASVESVGMRTTCSRPGHTRQAGSTPRESSPITTLRVRWDYIEIAIVSFCRKWNLLKAQKALFT